MPAIDLTGKRFGRLTALCRDEDRITKSGYRTVMWKCRCDCGNEIIVRSKCLLGGVTHSCGCLQRELLSQRTFKHGCNGTRLYAIWDSMRQRCNNSKSPAYKNYGGRGITICEEWDDFSQFKKWALASGYDEKAPRGKCTMDRINVNGNYEPSNCRWSNIREQTNNRRETIFIEYNNEVHALSEWADITGIKYCTLWSRYKHGASPKEILKPIK